MSIEEEDDDDIDEMRRLFADELLASFCLSLVLVRLEYGKGFDSLTSDNVLFSGSKIAEENFLSKGISLNGTLDVTLRAFDFASLSKVDFLTAILDARKVDDRTLIVFSTGSSLFGKAMKDSCISDDTFGNQSENLLMNSFQECFTR